MGRSPPPDARSSPTTNPNPRPAGDERLRSAALRPDDHRQADLRAATSPTGLDFGLDVNDEGLRSPNGLAASDIKKAVVTLPEGFTTNPSIAEGLAVCTEAEPARETALLRSRAQAAPTPRRSAPSKSKRRCSTKPSKAPLYVAKPYETPSAPSSPSTWSSRTPTSGVIVKQAGQGRTRPGHRPADDDRRRTCPSCPSPTSSLHFREGTRSPLDHPARLRHLHTSSADAHPLVGRRPDHHHLGLPDHHRPRRRPLPLGRHCRPSTPAWTPAPSTTPPAPTQPLLPPPHPQRLRTGDHPLLDQAAAGPHRQARRHPLLLRRGDRRGQSPRTRPQAEPKSSHSPSCPAASEVGHTLVGAGVGTVPRLRPRQGLPRRPLPRLRPLARRDHRRQGRPLRPRHRRRPPGAARSTPKPPKSSSTPPARTRSPTSSTASRSTCGTSAPTSTGPNFTLNPTSCERTSTASTVLGSGLDFASEADDQPGHRHHALPGRRLRQPRLQAEAGAQPQGRHQARRHPGLQGGPDLARPGDANIAKRPGHPAALGVPRPGPHQDRLHPGPVQRRRGPRRKVPGRTRSTATPGRSRRCSTNRSKARSTCAPPNHKLPDLVAALHSRQDRRRPRRPHRLGQNGRHPQHLRSGPRRPGDQVHPRNAGRQEGPAGQLDQPLQARQHRRSPTSPARTARSPTPNR